MIFLLAILLFFTGCVTTEYNATTHKRDFYFYSIEKEVAMGENISRQVASQFTLSRNSEYIKRVDRVGSKIAGVCDRKELKYYFYVIDKDEMNAFCIPGGHVYIFKGLLEKLENDDELAFVLAHEVGHGVSRHSIKKLQAAMGYNLALLATLPARKSSGFYNGASFAIAQIMSAYSREDEYMADELAVKYTKRAGFVPEAGIDVLEKLYSHNKKEPMRPRSYFRTHPYLPQRIKHIKETLGLPLTISDYIND